MACFGADFGTKTARTLGMSEKPSGGAGAMPVRHCGRSCCRMASTGVPAPPAGSERSLSRAVERAVAAAGSLTAPLGTCDRGAR